MSKAPGVNESLYKRRDECSDAKEWITHNASVAIFGSAADTQHVDALNIILPLLVTFVPMGKHRRACKKEIRELNAAFDKNTAAYVREAVESDDPVPLQMLADVVARMRHEPTHDVLNILKYYQRQPESHRYTKAELDKVAADTYGLLPPYDEALTKRVDRIIEMLGIKASRRRVRQ